MTASPHVDHAIRRRRRAGRRSRQGLGRRLQTWWQLIRATLAAVWSAPPAIRIPTLAALFVLLWLGVNWTYHALHKPTEVLFPLDDTLDKSPHETWRQYGSLFREHATTAVTPELLAALAQVEGGGNPVARTYWRWRPTWNPLELYRPASSAVGMYQMTDGTFRAAKRYCVHNHKVVEDGPWHDLRSCWFNSLYTRVLPSHAIELTAALLDRDMAAAIGARRAGSVGLQQKQDLAAVIHLCGAGAGRDFAARGFRLLPHQKCGDHDVATYLSHVHAMTQQFVRLASGGKSRWLRLESR